MNNLEHCKNVIGMRGDGNARLCVIYGWIKAGTVSFKHFKELMKYHQELNYKLYTQTKEQENV